MAYTKQTWQCGDEITADKLNNIENDLEKLDDVTGAKIPYWYYVNIYTDPEHDYDFVTDKTAKEIWEVLQNDDMEIVFNHPYEFASIQTGRNQQDGTFKIRMERINFDGIQNTDDQLGAVVSVTESDFVSGDSDDVVSINNYFRKFIKLLPDE